MEIPECPQPAAIPCHEIRGPCLCRCYSSNVGPWHSQAPPVCLAFDKGPLRWPPGPASETSSRERSRGGGRISRVSPGSSPGAGGNLLEERIAPRGGLPPLLTNLGDRPPEALQYLGTSFGLTQTLFNFWRKGGYSPVYLRQNASDITGAGRHHTFHEMRLLVY